VLAATPTKQRELSRSRMRSSSMLGLRAGRISGHARGEAVPPEFHGTDPRSGRNRPSATATRKPFPGIGGAMSTARRTWGTD
jgi:hypothetical protein